MTSVSTGLSKAARPFAFAVVGLLAGCIPYGSSEAIKTMPADLVKSAYVSDIDIKSVPADVSPEFRGKLDTALHEEMKKCAVGQHPLKLQVSITRFSPANPALTMLAGDSNVIRGSAQLIDPAISDSVIADYDINRSLGGGGIIGVIGMSGAEAKSSSAFAAEICKQAFGAK
jgi:hypothetical protein